MPRKKVLIEKVLQEYQSLKTTFLTAENIQRAINKGLNESLSKMTVKIEDDSKKAVQQAQDDYKTNEHKIISTLQTSIIQSGLAVLPWGSPGWIKHTPPINEFPPSYLRLGELRPNHIQTKIYSMPALVPFTSQRHIIISFENQQTQLSSQVIESLVWRVAALSSPTYYRFVLFDPLGLGTNLASLLKLPDDIRGSKIWCDDQDIEKVMRELSQDVQDIIHHRLLNTYQNIEAYNRANPDVSVPYHFLIIFGFPKGFTPKSAELLLDIARVGKGAGYFIIGGIIKEEKIPHDFDINSFMKSATCINVEEGNQLRWDDPEFVQIPIRADFPPSSILINQFAKTIPNIIPSDSAVIPFQRIAVHKANWWQMSSSEGLTIPVGIGETGNVNNISIGKGGIHHGLVGGTTGMGKTNLLHLLIIMLSITYSPDELELYLVDFKEGVEFQDYVTYNLPNAKAIVLEAEREFGLSVIQRLVNIMEERGNEFKAAGVTDIFEYRKHTGRKMPRILLIMDEFVVLFGEDDRIAMLASESLGSLVMLGRAFGIHIILSSQRPSSTFLSMSHIKSQIGLRMAFKCRPEDSTLILGEGNEKAARLSTHPGEACITSDPDRLDATMQVRIAKINTDERVVYLKGIQEYSHVQHYTRRDPMIVFSRTSPANWLQCRAVSDRMKSTEWKPFTSPLIWLGQPIRITEDLFIPLELHQGANLLIIGSDEDLAMRLLLSAVLGLCLTDTPQNSSFVCINTLNPQQAATHAFNSFQQELPNSIKFYARQKGVDKINELVGELERRISQNTNQVNARIYVLIIGLQRWIEARGPNSYTQSEVGKQFTRLIQQGSENGIHTLIWCDRLNTFGIVAGTLNPQESLAHFEHRIALQMTSDDSVNLLGIPHAAKLGSNRAYYRCEHWSTELLDKFKPYRIPSPDEIKLIVDTMKSRWAK
jgi:S-DNA-T family DNA segregation ATPase FtsK/SpoIIIE